MEKIPLKVLFIEDSEDDVVLLLRELQRGGFHTDHLRVDAAEPLRTALGREDWDVAVSDFHMPGFSGKEALDIVRSSGSDVPFVLVSGTVGEEVAVGAVKAGAQDFVSNDKPERLCRVIKRELKTLHQERERRRALAALRESEKRHRELMEHAFGLVFEIDCDGKVHSSNTAFLDMFA
ncbi:MAG: response regulator, partial [Myxococcota bacterium]